MKYKELREPPKVPVRATVEAKKFTMGRTMVSTYSMSTNAELINEL